MKRFGEKLRLLRIHNHITLKQLADCLGYATHSYISEIESAQKTPTVAFVISVARLFHCNTNELLFDELEITLTTIDKGKNDIQ
jgi:transcriptional regulator with XRE-family HTH domain